MPTPRRSTSTLCIPRSAYGAITRTFPPTARFTTPAIAEKNSAVASGNGFDPSGARANSGTPFRWHQSNGFASNSTFRPGRKTASSGVSAPGVPSPLTLQCVPYRSTTD